MKDLITKIERNIEELENIKVFLEEKSTYLYKNDLEGIRGVLPSAYDMNGKLAQLKEFKGLYQYLYDEGIDINKEYYIMPNIYLGFWATETYFSAYFYMKDTSFVYDNYIHSHSGANEWITDTIDDMYALYSGNSKYSYAFGTLTIKDIFKRLESDTMSYEDKADLAKRLISFVEGDGTLKTTIVQELEMKFETMQRLLDILD